jgi:Holliday junction resolvase RusA-like endonuclease
VAGYKIGDNISILFWLEMPQSWSQKKKDRLGGQPHQQTPDIDNMVKAVADALTPDNDSHIYSIAAEKRWSHGVGYIEISNRRAARTWHAVSCNGGVAIRERNGITGGNRVPIT